MIMNLQILNHLLIYFSVQDRYDDFPRGEAGKDEWHLTVIYRVRDACWANPRIATFQLGWLLIALLHSRSPTAFASCGKLQHHPHKLRRQRQTT